MAWTNFNNGDNGLSIRTALNAFLTTVDTFLTGNNQYTDVEKAKVGDNTTKVATLLAPSETLYQPQAPLLTAIEGRVYYDNSEGSLKVQGPIPGVEVSVGHTTHTHVVNNTGEVITKGMACVQAGVVNGEIQVQKAIATSFDMARIFGVAQQDIPNGGSGALITFGEIPNLNTLGYPTGVPLYLSDTVAGTYSEVAPTIISRVGGSLKQDGATGRLYVSMLTNVNLPTVLGALAIAGGGTTTYNITTTPQTIVNFTSKNETLMAADELLGTITSSYTGAYRSNVTMVLSFTSSNNTRTLEIDVFNETMGQPVGVFAKNIPKNCTVDSFSFGVPFPVVAGHVYKVRIAGDTMDITITSASFDLESISIT